MIWLKGCPKCSGDMHFDPLAEEYVCLQCGLSVDRPPPNQEEPSPRLLATGVASSPAGLPDRPVRHATQTASGARREGLKRS
jgi:hypothetical protein